MIESGKENKTRVQIHLRRKTKWGSENRGRGREGGIRSVGYPLYHRFVHSFKFEEFLMNSIIDLKGTKREKKSDCD